MTNRYDDFDAHTAEAIDLANEDRYMPGIDLLAEVVITEQYRERFERMLHPSAANGLCDVAARWPK